MENVPGPPDRSSDEAGGGADRPGEENPEIADVRDRFRRVSEDAAADEESARAFVEGKIEMIRTDPNMSEDEKKAAIAEIRGKSGREDEV